MKEQEILIEKLKLLEKEYATREYNTIVSKGRNFINNKKCTVIHKGDKIAQLLALAMENELTVDTLAQYSFFNLSTLLLMYLFFLFPQI